MKKTIFILLALFLASLVNINLASAKGDEMIYLVKKGDSIWKIAKEVFNVPWSEVKPEAKKRHLIYPGDQIILNDLLATEETVKKQPIISENQLRRDKKGLQALGLSEPEAEKIILTHILSVIWKKQTGFQWGIIRSGDKFAKILSGNLSIRQNAAMVWKDVKRLEAARVYTLSDGRQLWYPLISGKWSIKKKVFKKEIIPLPIK